MLEVGCSMLDVHLLNQSFMALIQRVNTMKIYHYPSKTAEKRIAGIINRSFSFKKKDDQAVTRILEDVRRNGDKAIVKYARKFDAPRMSVAKMKVTAREFEAASKKVDRTFVRSLNRAASQIQAFHQKQSVTSWMSTQRAGTVLGQSPRG
jgi:histidinol dehydrogenase